MTDRSQKTVGNILTVDAEYHMHSSRNFKEELRYRNSLKMTNLAAFSLHQGQKITKALAIKLMAQRVCLHKMKGTKMHHTFGMKYSEQEPKAK